MTFFIFKSKKVIRIVDNYNSLHRLFTQYIKSKWVIKRAGKSKEIPAHNY